MVVKNGQPKTVATSYRNEYDQYWAEDDRIGESSGDMEIYADRLVMCCGIGRVLDVGSGEGALVGALLRRGVDAYGVDVSEVVISRCNLRLPDRFTQGSVLALPYPDNSYQTVVSTDCMEHLASVDVPTALAEIYRVTSQNVFLQIATTQDRDGHWHLTVEGRAWWEKRCMEAGFRKHPAYYRINDYESLNQDGWQIYILLEKIQPDVRDKFPLSILEVERDLHMDMLRDVGERSDAHVIRYNWACNYIKPGDRVLDAACGLGYGGHVIRHLTRGAEVVGIDGSANSIAYATAQYGSKDARTSYLCGMLPEILASFADGSFDVIVSFETLEHVANPEALIAEFSRLLTPGGRVVVSVPNDWSDETGRDPNPHHLHVYNWQRLKSELAFHFILEDAFAQAASRCKVAARGNRWEPCQRSLQPVTWGENSPADSEWWLMTAMKSPLKAEVPYRERVFSNLLSAEHPSIRYAQYFVNSWLMHAMVNAEYRMRNPTALEELSTEVMAVYSVASNDYMAALCVGAYRALQKQDQDLRRSIVEDIDRVACVHFSDPMALRWRVSLLFVKAKLLEASGELIKAKEVFSECSHIDVREFGTHLATKTTEAAYLAGKLAYSLGEPSEAKRCWQDGVAIGHTLLKISLGDILINPDFPNLFNHGDGVREYAVAWDNIARCANGLHLLQFATPIDYSTLNNCLQSEYSGVTGDLVTTRQTLVERTGMLERTNDDLQRRTEELVQTRQTLVERTEMLERTSDDLLQRTEELVQTRQTLVERTEMLECTSDDLLQRTEELVQVRQTLVERTEMLERTNDDRERRNEELVHTRQALVERTEMLERTNGDLKRRTEELVETRQTLVERTEMLERTNDDLERRNEELVHTRQALVERTEMLERTNGGLKRRTDELVETRQTLVERTEKLEQAMDLLQQRTEELESYLSLPVYRRIFVRRMK